MDLAVKCPRPEFFHDELDKEDFEQEAETWVKLGLHPHTVACYYVRRLGGIPRVFAEFVEGGSLDKYLAGRPQPAPQAAELVRTLALAVQHARQQQLLLEQRDAVRLVLHPGRPARRNPGLLSKRGGSQANSRVASRKQSGGGKIHQLFYKEHR